MRQPRRQPDHKQRDHAPPTRRTLPALTRTCLSNNLVHADNLRGLTEPDRYQPNHNP